MDYRIKGKYAFINAGAHGIGEATADLLTQEGARVIVADRDGATLQEKAHRWAGVVAAELAKAVPKRKANASPAGLNLLVIYLIIREVRGFGGRFVPGGMVMGM